MAESMSKLDRQGKPWATVEGTKEGNLVMVDGDFICIKNGAIRAVKKIKDSLYIQCTHGKHYLDGQLETDADGTQFYLGVYPCE